MTRRPVFIPLDAGPTFVRTAYVEFDWHPGFSLRQSQRSIESLHVAAATQLGITDILEISTKSPSPLGVELSAFNLTFETVRHKRRFSIEAAYQGSKVFERGGPYLDLLEKPARDVKTDSRLRSSGDLIGFRFLNVDWELNPPTAFYDWLYINALRKQENLLREVMQYSAFSDIAFNPERSINCQAHSAALCVALARRGVAMEMLAKKEFYLELLNSQPQFALSSEVRMSKKANVAKLPKVDMAKSNLDNLKFPAWDAYKVVKSAVAKWQPKSSRSEDVEKSLFSFLVRELPDVEIKRLNRIGSGPDIIVGDSVVLEVKANLDSKTKYQDLLEQMNELREWATGVIVLLVGRTDPNILGSIESHATKYLKGQKIAVIQK